MPITPLLENFEGDVLVKLSQVEEHTARRVALLNSSFSSDSLTPDDVGRPSMLASGPVPPGVLLLPGQGQGAPQAAPHPIPGAEHPYRPEATSRLAEERYQNRRDLSG